MAKINTFFAHTGRYMLCVAPVSGVDMKEGL